MRALVWALLQSALNPGDLALSQAAAADTGHGGGEQRDDVRGDALGGIGAPFARLGPRRLRLAPRPARQPWGTT